MTRAIIVLEQEHKSLVRLLNLMDKLLIELDEGQSPDADLLEEIGEYLSGYPELCHHPKEDLIYRKLQNRDPAALESGSDLPHEHERLGEQIDRYIASLEENISQSGSLGKEFTSTMRELVDAYKHHMEREEMYFFPIAKKRLTEEDWAEIDYAISEQDDPLWDETSTKYARLRDEIYRMAEQHDQHARLLFQAAEASAQLDTFETVEQLNVMMKERGIRVKLTKRQDGSYCLKHGQETVLEMPVCDEKCAVWCAYGFVNGKYS